MSRELDSHIPPVRRSVSVSWDPETAFRRFTSDFAEWWPRSTHSVGGKLVERIMFECRIGGSIIEELKDGRRFLWGTITVFDPPHRVSFSWHPSREVHEAQDVDIRFIPEGSGTRVELVSTGWERLGPRAGRKRKGYDIGWGSVLDVFAGRRSLTFVLFAVISGVLTLALRLSGKLDRAINESGGRLPAR